MFFSAHNRDVFSSMMYQHDRNRWISSLVADPTGLQLELWLIRPMRPSDSLVPWFQGFGCPSHSVGALVCTYDQKTLPTELTHKGIIVATNQLAGTELWVQDTLKISTPD